MHSVKKSVLLWYSAQTMYDLVVDVEAYPQFLPWCASATVEHATAKGMRATLGIDYLGVKQHFTTTNTHTPGRLIHLSLERGPFSALQGQWKFTPLKDDACKIEFSLDYSFSNGLLERVVGPVFDTIASTFVDAFVKRAEAIHGELAKTTAPTKATQASETT
jgi:ribosome-associated toxin RatA of RatAB toxin-antitoxin module